MSLKIAASRIDKEVASGRMRYIDALSPEDLARADEGQLHLLARDLYGDSPETRRALRDIHHAPAVRSDAALATRRALNDASFRQKLRGKHNPYGGTHGFMLPGVGPATMGNRVFVPEHTGQFMRTSPRDMVAATMPFSGKKLVPERLPIDSTLNNAVFEHELGEAALMSRKSPSPVAPFASHLGTDPIIRENLTMHGDPDAQKLMGGLRQGHGDDAYVQKLIRQAGGTPDAPLPLHGRQHAAVDRRLAATPEHLDMQTRMRALKFNEKYPVSYIPRDMPSPKQELVSALRKSGPEARTLLQNRTRQGLMDFGTSVVKKLQNTPVGNFVTKGKIGAYDAGMRSTRRALGV
jgi:hypothetical protein